MMKNNLTKIVLILVVLALIGLGLGIKLNHAPNFHYAGTLEATKVDLSAEVASRLAEVLVHEGEWVEAGAELARLACEDLKVTAALARQNYERARRLAEKGSGSQEILDLMASRKDETEVRLGGCSIKAPLAARVLNRYHEPGEWVMPGTKLLTLANIRDISVYIYVPAALVYRLKPGMKLAGALPELPGRTFVGEIIKINEEAEFTPKNVQTRSERERLVFGVKVSFRGQNDDELLKPGMTIEIDLPFLPSS